LGLSVLAVPDVAGPRPLLEPDAAARYNVLVVHGEVEHVAPAAEPCGWDYVALGHYHVQREMAPRMGYAGALDYTSSNPWGELAEERASGVPGKGFVTYDLEARTRAFHPVARPRAFVELPAIDGSEKEPAAIDTLIRCAVERYEGGIEGKVVRLVVRDIPRATARGLDLRAIRALRARVLNFQLVLDRPSETIAVGTERTARRPLKSLADIVREGLAKRALPGDVDREALTALALKFLDTATERAEIGAVEPTEATA
jgi:DNA repair exonuclease SbcCD nuclease subunit